MEAQEYFQDQIQPKQNQILNLDIEIMPVEDYYLFRYQANLNPDYANLFINQTFILLILELRSGMSQRAISVLKASILNFCEEALQKNLNGFGFIINGEYHTIKKPNYDAIKDILNTYMTVSKEDNYLLSLRKLKHVLQKQIYKYDKKIEFIDMVFFTSYVEIDHSLGVKKRSYIEKLNEHSDDCHKEVNRISKILSSQIKSYNAHVIGLEKKGLQDQDYSQADRDLFNYIHFKLGKITSLIVFYWIEQEDPSLIYQAQFQEYRPTSYTKLMEGFNNISSLILSTSLALEIKIPIETGTEKQEYLTEFLYSQNMTSLNPYINTFIKKKSLSLQKIYENQIQLSSRKIQETYKQKQVQKQKLENQKQKQGNQKQNQGNQKYKQKQELKRPYKIKSCYTELQQTQISFQIYCKTLLFDFQLKRICQQLKEQIVSWRRIYDGNNKSHLEMKVDEEKQQILKDRIFYIEKQGKIIYQQIFDTNLFPSKNQNCCRTKRQTFERYSALKRNLDAAQEVLMNIIKKQIKNDLIGTICRAVTFWNLRNSLKNKLVRRINLNPKMIDNTYSKVHQIASQSNYTALQTSNKKAKHAIGYCVKSNINFATALRKQDCLGVLIQVQRPDSAIADPGRIRIRQISPFAMSVTNFFNVYHYEIQSFGRLNYQNGGQWIRQYAGLQKQNYQQMWDYWAQTERKYTVTALVPVYLCRQHWQIAKLLMKPCLGWLATGQPLGYTYSQAQTIPFMVLSFAIRRVQQIKYQIDQLQGRLQKKNYKVTEYSLLQRQVLDKRLLKTRMQDLCWVLQETCYQIMKDMSVQNLAEKLSDIVIEKYRNYIEHPIQRTIDVISNNSAFLSQVYCVIKLQMMERPDKTQFQQFFKRLVQEQLRRQTDGWNQEQTQDLFINKLLNSQVQKMDLPEFVILDSEHYDKFQQLRRGQRIHKTYLQITRNELEMMLTKNGKFNDTQKMLLIQYKRLYQNRVIWMWYLQFRLFQEVERVKIHKWNCLDLFNSYMLFTLIIQNKKQRKNYKRREAILKHEYVDPFHQEKARQFLEIQFLRLRGNKERKNIQILNTKKHGNAASTFAYTKSFEQAAGTLINFDQGQHCVAFFNEIVKGQGVRLQQKLRMLLQGKYKDVELFRGWTMSTKRTNKLRKVYPQLFQRFGYMF